MLYTERLYWMKNLTCDIFMCVTQPQITSILRFLDNHAYITTMGGKEKVLFFRFCGLLYIHYIKSSIMRVMYHINRNIKPLPDNVFLLSGLYL